MQIGAALGDLTLLMTACKKFKHVACDSLNAGETRSNLAYCTVKRCSPPIAAVLEVLVTSVQRAGFSGKHERALFAVTLQARDYGKLVCRVRAVR